MYLCSYFDLFFSCPQVDSAVVFWATDVKVDALAVFQLSLTAPSDVSISDLPITALEIHFSSTTGTIPSIVVRHSQSESEEESNKASLVRKVDLGHGAQGGEEQPQSREVEAELRWRPGATIVFSGTLSSKVPTSLKVCNCDSTVM